MQTHGGKQDQDDTPPPPEQRASGEVQPDACHATGHRHLTTPARLRLPPTPCPVGLSFSKRVQERTGCTPATLMFGRKLWTPVNLALGAPPDTDLPRIPVFEFARQHQEQAGARQKRGYDLRCQGHSFMPGERVWVYNPTRKKTDQPVGGAL